MEWFQLCVTPKAQIRLPIFSQFGQVLPSNHIYPTVCVEVHRSLFGLKGIGSMTPNILEPFHHMNITVHRLCSHKAFTTAPLGNQQVKEKRISQKRNKNNINKSLRSYFGV